MRLSEIAQSLEERFNREKDKRSHFMSHVTKDGSSNDPNYPDKKTFTFEQFPNSRVYEEAADRFAKTPITEPNILGYIRKRDGKYCKYNKETHEFVVYSIENDEPIIITYFPCERSYYDNCKEKRYPYGASIDPEKDVK